MASQMDRWWADYEEHHRTAGNQWCHLVGIPLIAAGTAGLLAVEVFRWGTWPVEASLLLIVVVSGGYLWLDARLGSLFAGFLVVVYLGMRQLDWKPALAAFVVGWAFQFIGHGVYEKRSPAFFKNLMHLMVGPLWVANHVVRLRPGRQPVHTTVTGSR